MSNETQPCLACMGEGKVKSAVHQAQEAAAARKKQRQMNWKRVQMILGTLVIGPAFLAFGAAFGRLVVWASQTPITDGNGHLNEVVALFQGTGAFLGVCAFGIGIYITFVEWSK